MREIGGSILFQHLVCCWFFLTLQSRQHNTTWQTIKSFLTANFPNIRLQDYVCWFGKLSVLATPCLNRNLLLYNGFEWKKVKEHKKNKLFSSLKQPEGNLNKITLSCRSFIGWFHPDWNLNSDKCEWVYMLNISRVCRWDKLELTGIWTHVPYTAVRRLTYWANHLAMLMTMEVNESPYAHESQNKYWPTLG